MLFGVRVSFLGVILMLSGVRISFLGVIHVLSGVRVSFLGVIHMPSGVRMSFLAVSGDILCVWVDSGLLLDKVLRIKQWRPLKGLMQGTLYSQHGDKVHKTIPIKS